MQIQGQPVDTQLIVLLQLTTSDGWANTGAKQDSRPPGSYWDVSQTHNLPSLRSNQWYVACPGEDVPGCITQEEMQQMSTQIIIWDFTVLQNLVVITGNESAGLCTHQRLGGYHSERAKNDGVIENILGIALKQGTRTYLF